MFFLNENQRAMNFAQSYSFLVIFFIAFSEVHLENKSSIPLYFSYITSLTGSGFTASGGVPMVDIALQNINSRGDILVNYTLKHNGLLDSKCDRNMALNAFFRHFQNSSQPTYISTFCCGCSTATIPVAEISHYWNIPHMSVSTAIALGNRQRFKNFFRTSPTYLKVPFGIMRMIAEFGWRKMMVISQNEDLFHGLSNALEILFESRKWIIDKSIVIESNVAVFPYHKIFDKIESEFFRIVFINAYSQYAYYILCEAYHRGYTSEKIVWITHSWYNREWWNYVEKRNSSCSSSTLEAALAGSIAVIPDGLIIIENKTAETTSGLTPEKLLQLYDESIVNDTYSGIYVKKTVGPSVFYDLIWSLALGLNETAKRVAEMNETGCEMFSGELVPLESFNYSNQKMGCLLRESIQQVYFDGLSGKIKFDESGGQPDNLLTVQQYRHSGNRLIRENVAGIYVLNAENASFHYKNNENKFTLWKDGPPYDGYPMEAIHHKSIILFILYAGLSFAGIIFSCVCLIFNMYFRNASIVKLTSPNLNYVIILGTVSLYCCACLYSTSQDDTRLATFFCNFRTWLFSFGYTLCFAVILAKTWRIYYIFNNPTPTKKIIKDWMLFVCIGVILSVDMVVLLIGTALPSSRIKAIRIIDKYQVDSTNDKVLEILYIHICTKGRSVIWLAVSLAYKGILQIVAIVMAFHIRRVKIKALNDSKEIAAIIYINSIILVIMAVSLFMLEEYHNLHAALFGLALLVQATLFLGILFIPKMLRVYKKDEVVVTSLESDIAHFQLPGHLKQNGDMNRVLSMH